MRATRSKGKSRMANEQRASVASASARTAPSARPMRREGGRVVRGLTQAEYPDSWAAGKSLFIPPILGLTGDFLAKGPQLPFSPELELVIACCRWPPSAAREEAVRVRSTGRIDWEVLGKVAARHRVEGLVHDALRRSGIVLPPPVQRDLHEEALRIARNNLVFAAESARLASALDKAGIKFLFLKGLTLNMLAYGTLGVKKAVDIDLVVDPDAYEEAVQLLEQRGYRCILPGPSASRAELLEWADRVKHTEWRRNGVPVELHKSFVDSPLLLRGVSIHSPVQRVELGQGMSLPTLEMDELFTYLCVHGATHGWSRLKWPADLAALLKSDDGGEVERLYRRSLELGAGRCSGQALLLCSFLFETPLPAGLQAELREDRAIRYLAGVATGAMAAGSAISEPDDRLLGTLAIHISHLRLAPGWSYKAAELRRKLGAGAEQGDSFSSSTVFQAIVGLPQWLLRRRRTKQERKATRD